MPQTDEKFREEHRKSHTDRTIAVGRKKLTQHEASIFKNYALGMRDEDNAKLMGSTKGAIGISIFRTCRFLSINRGSSSALALCLFHGLLCIDDIFEFNGLTGLAQ